MRRLFIEIANTSVSSPTTLVEPQKQVSENFVVNLSAENLTNGTYFTSADNRAPYAQGRSFRLELVLGN